jgi:CRISPR-associated helicase Cas3/CRISPR-associated endonuclease Cas3-HD
MQYYAHSVEGSCDEDWEGLADHLRRVADLAQSHGGPARVGAWARLAGLLHDIGKSSAAFQARLRGAPAAVDHSTAGAQVSVSRWESLGRVLAYPVAGHHAGLPDFQVLWARLQRTDLPVFDSTIVDLPSGLPPIPFEAPGSRLAGSLFVRMIFSSLVDADFLATEQFYAPGVTATRGRRGDLDPLIERLESALAEKRLKAPQTPINAKRRDIQDACRNAAVAPPGLFSLTVPTGGGKTLASLLFALHHARSHGLRRVIFAIPYTSIIEQTAAVFREILGAEAVLEHHSGVPAPEADDAQGVDAFEKLKLDAENWDAPVVVTTNVQLFESLFAARPAACRKLHAIAGSVVVLDEAQMLPVAYLRPCIAALQELAANYRVSPVLCTATQPALERSEWLSEGLEGVREIAPNPEELHVRFRRVTVAAVGKLDDEALAQALSERSQVLCIVDTRGHAAELFAQLRDRAAAGSHHLSARMCPAHRREKLATIRAELQKGAPCRVVSTQLIEAGVDVDFPEVFRALAGLDSIAQAAGRCNREQRQALGTLHLFETDRSVGLPDWRRRIACARAVLDSGADPLSPAAQKDFFRRLYDLAELDEKGIMDLLSDPGGELVFDFRTAADRFRFVESAMEPVVVPIDSTARDRIAEVERSPTPGKLARGLDPYTVQLHSNEVAALRAAGAVRPTDLGVHILVNDSLYDDELGLRPDDPGHVNLDTLLQ